MSGKKSDPRTRWKTCQRGTKWYVYVHYNVCVYIYIHIITHMHTVHMSIYIITHMHTVHMNNINYRYTQENHRKIVADILFWILHDYQDDYQSGIWSTWSTGNDLSIGPPGDQPLHRCQERAGQPHDLRRQRSCALRPARPRAGTGTQILCAAWWFGTMEFYDFPYIGNNHPNWLICFKGVETTNQCV